jgi:hypothetical protein
MGMAHGTGGDVTFESGDLCGPKAPYAIDPFDVYTVIGPSGERNFYYFGLRGLISSFKMIDLERERFSDLQTIAGRIEGTASADESIRMREEYTVIKNEMNSLFEAIVSYEGVDPYLQTR